MTDFTHYSLIADGRLVEDNATFDMEKGPAVIGLKVWAEDTDQAADMIIAFANHQGFKIADRIEVYETEPERPAEDRPYAYNINFTPYDEDPPRT